MTTLFDVAGVQARIFTLPDRPAFMIAPDLAEVYGTSVKALNQAATRNPERFPEDFMFALSETETGALRSHSVTANKVSTVALRSHSATANTISAKVRYAPNVFTHAGALMLSAVLKTPTAAQVSVIVHRAFAAMEQAALEDARLMLTKLRTEEAKRRPIRIFAREGVLAGLSFEQIWRMGTYSRPRVADALRECLVLGLIDALPAGMPAEQLGLFSHA